jgi:hypothetical protein
VAPNAGSTISSIRQLHNDRQGFIETHNGRFVTLADGVLSQEHVFRSELVLSSE